MRNDDRTSLKPPTDPDPEPPPPPPPPVSLSAERVEFAAGPYRVDFDRSEPGAPHPGHTGSPQLRLVEVAYKDTPLIRGMSGFLASHEISPGVYAWMGGSHGYERAGGWAYSHGATEASAISHSWIGPVDLPLAEREVEYRLSYSSGVLGLRVATSTRALRPHRVRDVYDFMLPLSRAAFTSWRADTNHSEAIHMVVREPSNTLTDDAITVRARGHVFHGIPNLWYQGHQGAPIYARQLPDDTQCKLYHRSRWQRPVMLEAGQELRSTVSMFIGEHC